MSTVRYELDFSTSKDFDEFPLDCHELFNPLEVELKDNECSNPIPWDADIAIKEGVLVISGGIDAGGFGSCVCKLRKDLANRVYVFKICVYSHSTFIAERLFRELDIAFNREGEEPEKALPRYRLKQNLYYAEDYGVCTMKEVLAGTCPDPEGLFTEVNGDLVVTPWQRAGTEFFWDDSSGVGHEVGSGNEIAIPAVLLDELDVCERLS